MSLVTPLSPHDFPSRSPYVDAAMVGLFFVFMISMYFSLLCMKFLKVGKKNNVNNDRNYKVTHK